MPLLGDIVWTFANLVPALGASIFDTMGFWAVLLLPMVICPLWAIFGKQGMDARRALMDGTKEPEAKPPSTLKPDEQRRGSS